MSIEYSGFLFLYVVNNGLSMKRQQVGLFIFGNKLLELKAQYFRNVFQEKTDRSKDFWKQIKKGFLQKPNQLR